jgi:hypothetical protein
MPSTTSGRSSVEISSIRPESWARASDTSGALSGTSIGTQAGNSSRSTSFGGDPVNTWRHTGQGNFLYQGEPPRSSLEYQSLVNINDLQQRVTELEERVDEMAVQERDKLALHFLDETSKSMTYLEASMKSYEMADAMLEARKWE